MPFKRKQLTRSSGKFIRKKMDKIRRSFRDSFRRRGSRGNGGLTAGSGGGAGTSGQGNKPQMWQQDEAAVRSGNCSFAVKYLGCVEVFDSRGMKVCEEALKILRSQRRSPVKAVLYVSGDGLRVVDAENKGLIVDQTIEKVSFCAPDRHHESGFAYICRDGTTRRWMCHGFNASKETGERLSHAVGCAFAVCLEKKQRRDRDATLKLEDRSASVDSETPFKRQDFKRATLTERLEDPQNVKTTDKPPVKPVENPHAVSRPQANPDLLFKREGSLRMGSASQEVSPFKRNFSLRLNELPSNMSRQHQISVNGQKSSISAIPELSPLPESLFLSEELDPLSAQPKVLQVSQQQQSTTNIATAEPHPSLQRFEQTVECFPATSYSAPSSSRHSSRPAIPGEDKSRADMWLEETTVRVQQMCFDMGGAENARPSMAPSSGGGPHQPSSVVNHTAVMTGASTAAVPNQQPLANGFYHQHQRPPPPASPPPPIEFDIFGQPKFAAPLAAPVSSTSMPLHLHQPHQPPVMMENAGFVDPFEQKWASLKPNPVPGAKPAAPPRNPFADESVGVSI